MGENKYADVSDLHNFCKKSNCQLIMTHTPTG